jgi:hypothetical protein
MWTPRLWYEEARATAAADPAKVRTWADFIISRYRELPQGRDDRALLALLDGENRRRLAAAPDLALYPELRGMAEMIAAQWRGTADAAGLSPLQAAAHANGLWTYVRLTSSPEPSHGCSYVFFPHSDVGPILANNLDSSPDEPFGAPVWIPHNEHVILGGVSCGVFYDEESPEIFPAPVFKLVARYCRSTDEAVEMLTRYSQFWGPCNLIVIDRRKRVAMVEKSRCRIGVRYSPDGFGFITAMTMNEPAMKAYLHDRRAYSLKARGLAAPCNDTDYWAEADHRYQLMTELLDEARRAPTLEKLRQIIQFRDPVRGKVCYNGERLKPEYAPCEFTLRTSIWLLREGRAQWWAKQGDTPSFANRQPDVTYPDALRWE